MLTPLRLCLVALVATNVAFVHLTGAVQLLWVLPLYALTLAAPWLNRLHERIWYRLAWNGGVLTIFGLLVQHTTGSGIRHLLEDGLILAAFCQVHLLNNLGGKQKPDLVFFNSFLIALVTSFFSQDLAYCGVFVVYAWLLLLGLELYTIGPRPRIVAGSLRRTAIVVSVTFGAFLLVPRDFRREGLMNDEWFDPSVAVGFRDAVELGESGRARRDDSLVFTVQAERGTLADIEGYWRGATCSYFDGKSWRPDLDPQTPFELDARPWTIEGSTFQRRTDPADGARATVELLESTGRLFVSVDAGRVQMRAPAWQIQVLPLRDGTFVAMPTPDWLAQREPMHYTVTLADPGPIARGPRPARYLQLPTRHDGFPIAGRRLAAELSAGQRLRTDADRLALAERMAGALRDRYRYLLPGETGAARNLADFFQGPRARIASISQPRCA